MTLAILTYPLFRALDANGNPLAGGKLYAYAAGTSTPLALLAADGTTPLANPVVLDANGQAAIRLGSNSYKLDLFDATDVRQTGWPVDNVTTLPRPDLIDDWSASLGQMQTMTDPGELGSEVLPTTAAGEIQEQRYALYDVKHAVDPSITQWYQTPMGLGWLNVKGPGFGAKGDGVTDDTAAARCTFRSGPTSSAVPSASRTCATSSSSASVSPGARRMTRPSPSRIRPAVATCSRLRAPPRCSSMA